MMILIKTMFSKKNKMTTLGIDRFDKSFSRSSRVLTPSKDESILFNHMDALCQR